MRAEHRRRRLQARKLMQLRVRGLPKDVLVARVARAREAVQRCVVLLGDHERLRDTLWVSLPVPGHE